VKKKFSESDLAKVVVEYLSSIGWDVYQEVKVSYGGKIADIVAVLGKRTWVVETKTTLNLSVLEQANYWKRISNYVSIAVPKAKYSSGREFAKLICRERGIGIFYIDVKRSDDFRVKTIEEARLGRWADKVVDKWFLRENRQLRNMICEEHKTYALAGNSDGKHWSTFKATCKRVAKFVSENPGCNMREIVAKIDHHYSSDNSAYTSLLHWISIGKVDGLVTDTTKRPFRFYIPGYKGTAIERFRIMLSTERYRDG